MMVAASFDLVFQGLALHKWSRDNASAVVGGMLIGLAFIIITHHRAEKHDQVSHTGGKMHGKKIVSWKNAFIIIIIMTLHSGAEWLAMGVAQGASHTLGLFVFIVMALQNIPEWLAISLQLVPQGTPWWRAWLRSIVTSLPQPLLAVPAFYFVETFAPLVPRWLGFAAGCMLWMCFGDITAESYKGTDHSWVGIIATLSIVFMLILQTLVG
jgi:zinc transporter, ZIP family